MQASQKLKRYYTWEPKFATEEEARASIRHHMRDNMRRTLADDTERADRLIAEVGGNYENHRPKYVKPGVWSRLSEYWVSDEFKRKSIAGKAAREKVKAPHTSGVRSFDRRCRGKTVANDDDDTDYGGSGDCSTDSEDHDISPLSNVVSKGGPVIRG